MALSVHNMRWLGVAVEDPLAAAAFFRDLLGVRLLFEEADSVELETQEGDRIQLFGPASAYFERARRPLPLFEVQDAAEAHAAPAVAGASVEPLKSDDEWTWFDVNGPEGFVCELGSRR
jgi:catechol 2,3-dioxygenase-like lactoylglutathione lyase family enzyme